MSDTRTDRGVRSADLDDVILLAARRAESEPDELSVDEVKRIAAELEIAPEAVDAAIAELKRQRLAEAAAAGAARAGEVMQRKRLTRIGLAIAAVLALLVAWTPISLGGKLATVEQLRSQVSNVVARQRSVNARLGDRAPDRAVDAELSGAENRVRIEQRHYDAAATAYNRAASGLPAGIFRGLFGYPESVPLSADVQWGAADP